MNVQKRCPIRSAIAVAVVFGAVTGVAPAALAQRMLSPVIPGICEYLPMPEAAIQPQAAHVYRMIFDASRSAGKPDELLPAVFLAAGELNALGACGVPVSNRRGLVPAPPARPSVISRPFRPRPATVADTSSWFRQGATSRRPPPSDA